MSEKVLPNLKQNFTHSHF